MNKNELIETVACQADISKSKATLAVDAMLRAVMESVAKREDVTLVGFGTFTAQERAAREGRNPQTGETIRIAASIQPKFRAGKNFRDMLN